MKTSKPAEEQENSRMINSGFVLGFCIGVFEMIVRAFFNHSESGVKQINNVSGLYVLRNPLEKMLIVVDMC